MSQPNKRKAKEPKKGAKKPDLSKSPKQGVSMSAQKPEEKPKASQLAMAEGSRQISSTSKPSDKPKPATAHKSTDSSKDKSASSRSTKPTGATGGKQQQPQSTMGLGWSKSAPVDTKEKSPTKSMPEASVHKTTEPKLQDKKPMLSAVDQLVDTLPSQGPDPSIPKYTGPEVKESSDSKKKAERVGETEESIPPEYRFTEPSDPKDQVKKGPSPTHPETKPKGISEGDALDSLSADFGLSSAAPISKCSAATTHSVAPPPVLKEATAKSSSAVSASKSDSKGEDPFDLLAGTLPSEAPDDSGPKYTGPEVKESDVTKKKAERVGETEGSIPPDYRFKEQPDPKGKDKVASSSTGPGVKPQEKEKSTTEDDVLESLSADFDLSSSAPISKCSAVTSHSAVPLSAQKQEPLKASTAATVSAGKSDAKGEDPFDLLAGTLPSEAPDNSGPKYTGPEVKESDAKKKKAERVGETEESIPPDYRFKEQPDPKDKAKGGPSSTGPGARPKFTEKSMTQSDVIASLSADFAHSPPAPISKSSASSSHSAPPPPSLKQILTGLLSTASIFFVITIVMFFLAKAPLKAASAASVSASKSGAKDTDPLDLLAGTLPSEAPDNSASKYTGPAVKESDAEKKKAERVGETEESIPPDYRFSDPKDKGKVPSSSTGPGAKPKRTEKKMTEDDVLDSLDFVESFPAPISKCSAAPSHSAPPPPSLKQAPLKASTAATVSADRSDMKGEDPFDLLAGTLPSQAPDDSGPKYTGPEVKEADVTKKKAERVGETEGSIPPDYRFKEQPDPKDKGKVALSSSGPGAKPKETEKKMTDDDVLESLSAEFVHSTPAPISKCSAPTSHSAAPPSVPKEAPLKASTAAPVSVSQTGIKDEDPFDLLAGTLPSQAPDDSGPKYTGPEVKESDAKKKKAEQVGETEESIPPDYRFKEQPDHKDKSKGPSSSTGPGAKPRETEKCPSEVDALDTLSADFGLSSQAAISKCSAAPTHSAAPPFVPKEVPLKASTAASVSASQSDTKKGEDPFDLLAETLPTEAPDNSAPRYTGPEVKEADVTKKKAERVGETEGSIPPDYRFKEQPDLKDKDKIASSSAGTGTKPKSVSEDDVVESLSADFVQRSPAPVSKCSAPISQCAAPPPSLKQGEDPVGLLAATLPTEAPDNSGPKYTGPAVKETDHSKKKPELVGETEESIPPDYRFTEQLDPKDKGKQASSSSGPGAKPKATEKLPSEAELIECMASEFDSPPASHSGAQISKQKEAGHNTASVRKTDSAPKTNDHGPKSSKAKTQPAAKNAHKR
ncbi:calpastatin isoform X3 [Stegostoma tigrinum]|uniref:calpastatin isoform X3 n=1 Tax=Stegostoma tigrinum TaxID=3053191 RepID=UPI00286FFEE6|nr:calpastatin isoform X3 [Stegostoma tigrinum]